jgi:DNA-binding response OmpR family regulator
MAHPPFPRRLVLIEPDEDIAALVRMILATDAVVIHAAANGRQGLELIHVERPALVILDLSLPDMNGWELYMQMQSEGALAEVPVILLASQASRVDRNFGLKVAQVRDYVLKPFLPSQLRRSVAAALGNAPEYVREIRQYPA